jgi:uncharacterized protein YbjT (DUF2867 family)
MQNGVPVYVLVSSAGADLKSKVFYSRMKAELERDAGKLNFKSIYFIRPSLLVGHRRENRIGEKAGFIVLKFLNAFGALKKYKPVSGEVVAQAMVNCALKADKGKHIIELKKVFEAAGL